jgi:hypothetical protein
MGMRYAAKSHTGSMEDLWNVEALRHEAATVGSRKPDLSKFHLCEQVLSGTYPLMMILSECRLHDILPRPRMCCT